MGTSFMLRSNGSSLASPMPSIAMKTQVTSEGGYMKDSHFVTQRLAELR
jgi:hypothetical protein